MNAIKLDSFNSWVGYALSDLARAPGRDLPHSREAILDMVMTSLRHALRRANEMGCAARRALCMRLMNWIRHDMRRAA